MSLGPPAPSLPGAGARPPAPRRTLLRSPLYLRMVASVAGVLLIPAVITSTYNIERSSAARLESSQPQLLQSTEAKATAVEAILLRSISDVLFLGQTPSLQRYARELAVSPAAPAEDVSAFLRSFLSRSAGLYDGISVLDRMGQEQVSLRVEGSHIRLVPREELRSRAQAGFFSGAMSLAGISGRLAPVYLSPAERLTGPEGASPPPSEPSIRYAALLFSLDGSVAGVLVLSSPLKPIVRPLTADEPTDHVYLVDASGDYLVGGRSAPGHGAPGTNLRRQRPIDAREILGRPSGTLLDTPEQPGFLQAFARIRPAGQGTIQWTVVCERPISTILAREKEIGTVIFATTAGSLVLALLVTVVFIRGIAHPINQLAAAAGDISQGYWGTPLPSQRRSDEIGELTEAFSRMAHQLQATWRDLERNMDGLRRSEGELRASRNLLQALIDHSSTSISMKSAEGRYLLVNRQLASLARREPEECLGKRDAELWPPELAARREEMDRQVLATSRSITTEEEVPLPEGLHTFLSVHFPLMDEARAPYAVATISTDITDRKRAEDALLRAHAELDQRVQERTRELREAQRRLVEAARLAGREEITTTILHNVGNVASSLNIAVETLRLRLRQSRVTALGKALDLMREHSMDLGRYLTEDPKGRILPSYLPRLAQELREEQVGLITEVGGLQKGLDHINNIITVQQSLASRTFQVIEEIDVGETADEALRIQLQHAPDIEVVRDYEPLPRLHTDRHKLLEILINLLSNAQQAMRASSAPRRLEVRIRNAGECVRIQVKDNGVGISEEKMPHIFQFGFTDKAGGHGFGLHGCALHAQGMGGSLRAQSDGLGHGATFTLELPWTPRSPAPGTQG